MSIPLPPLMSHRVLAQIDHDSRCLRQHDPVARPRPLRERPCRFAIPPAPLSARSRPVNTLGPSRALRDATLQPLTSEWRENGKPASDGEIHKLAMETQAAAQKLKARTLRSDIFFVEANASFEAASARSVVTNATRKAAVKERVLARPRCPRDLPPALPSRQVVAPHRDRAALAHLRDGRPVRVLLDARADRLVAQHVEGLEGRVDGVEDLHDRVGEAALREELVACEAAGTASSAGMCGAEQRASYAGSDCARCTLHKEHDLVVLDQLVEPALGSPIELHSRG